MLTDTGRMNCEKTVCHRTTIFSLLVLAALTLAACTPMGPGMMGRGMMGRGMMGPGMMGGPVGEPPAVTPAPTATPGGHATVSFRQDVLPIFQRRCVVCHGGQKGLWLDSYEHVMAGGEDGAVVIPGDPQASELVRRITGRSQPAMPLGQEPLSDAEVTRITRWIQEGAPNN